MVQLPILLAETALVNRKSLARLSGLSDINLRALRKCSWPSRRGWDYGPGVTWQLKHEWDGDGWCIALLMSSFHIAAEGWHGLTASQHLNDRNDLSDLINSTMAGNILCYGFFRHVQHEADIPSIISSMPKPILWSWGGIMHKTLGLCQAARSLAGSTEPA